MPYEVAAFKSLVIPGVTAGEGTPVISVRSPQQCSFWCVVGCIGIQLHVYVGSAAHTQLVRDYLSQNVGRTPRSAVEFERRIECPVLMKVHGSGKQELTAASPLPGTVSSSILEKQNPPVFP